MTGPHARGAEGLSEEPCQDVCEGVHEDPSWRLQDVVGAGEGEGGVRVDEPGADLAVALALASAHRGEPLGTGGKPLACFGEVGLTGELRYVAHADRRLKEAARFGLKRVIAPLACIDDGALAGDGNGAFGASTLGEALAFALGPRVRHESRAA